MPRYRILQFRGDTADGWLREFDKFGGNLEAFARDVVITNRQFYGPAPEPRGPITIPRGSVTSEVTIDGRRISLTVCREPKFILLEEVRG